MRNVVRVLISLSISFSLISVGCALRVAPAPTSENVTLSPTTSVKAPWEQKWEKVQADARNEGALQAFADTVPEVNSAAAEAGQEEIRIRH